MSFTLMPGATTLTELEAIWRSGGAVALHESTRAKVDAAAALVAEAAAGEAATYGVNTGFGKLATIRIAESDTATLQRNLIRSHASGTGDRLPVPIVRGTMLLLAASLSRGRSGVRPELVEKIVTLLNQNITPCVPELGSVGAVLDRENGL